MNDEIAKPTTIKQTRMYGGLHLPDPTIPAPKADEPIIMPAAKIKGTSKDNNWEAVNLVEVEGRWIATAECRGIGAQIQVPRHVVKMVKTDPDRARHAMASIARDLRRKLNLNLRRAGQRPLPAVPEPDPTADPYEVE